MSLQHNDQIYLDDDGLPLSEDEANELARHIVEQGAEAGFDLDAVHDAEARLAAAAALEAYVEREIARGPLAFQPERLPCYDCTRAAGLDVMNDDTVIQSEVVALGPVVNPADPTQSYKLACGHTTI